MERVHCSWPAPAPSALTTTSERLAQIAACSVDGWVDGTWLDMSSTGQLDYKRGE